LEALFTLRAALDQVAYATAVAAGKVRPKNSYFPVADDAAQLETVIKGRCGDLPNEVKSPPPWSATTLLVALTRLVCLSMDLRAKSGEGLLSRRYSWALLSMARIILSGLLFQMGGDVLVDFLKG
jgi:hypothetical protein